MLLMLLSAHLIRSLKLWERNFHDSSVVFPVIWQDISGKWSFCFVSACCSCGSNLQLSGQYWQYFRLVLTVVLIVLWNILCLHFSLRNHPQRFRTRPSCWQQFCLLLDQSSSPLVLCFLQASSIPRYASSVYIFRHCWKLKLHPVTVYEFWMCSCCGKCPHSVTSPPFMNRLWVWLTVFILSFHIVVVRLQ